MMMIAINGTTARTPAKIQMTSKNRNANGKSTNVETVAEVKNGCAVNLNQKFLLLIR